MQCEANPEPDKTAYACEYIPTYAPATGVHVELQQLIERAASMDHNTMLRGEAQRPQTHSGPRQGCCQRRLHSLRWLQGHASRHATSHQAGSGVQEHVPAWLYDQTSCRAATEQEKKNIAVCAVTSSHRSSGLVVHAAYVTRHGLRSMLMQHSACTVLMGVE